MDQTKLSICVPTYNRAKYLERLLKNIECQNLNEIEVVIVNDGSKDNTNEIIQLYKNKVKIIYFEQENQGRSNALKKAIQIATGEFTLIMDDEDLFKENSLLLIIKNLKTLSEYKFKSKREINGLVFLTENVDGVLIGNEFPKSPFVSNLVAINADFNSIGDKKQVVKTKNLQEVLYDTYPDERRMSTYVLWSRLAKNFDIVFINEIVVIKEYLAEGLSKNINKVRMKSPMSSKLIYRELLEMNKDIYNSVKYRFKNASNFYRYNFHSKERIQPKASFIYKLVGSIIGYIIYKWDCNRYSKK